MGVLEPQQRGGIAELPDWFPGRLKCEITTSPGASSETSLLWKKGGLLVKFFFKSEFAGKMKLNVGIIKICLGDYLNSIYVYNMYIHIYKYI